MQMRQNKEKGLLEPVNKRGIICYLIGIKGKVSWTLYGEKGDGEIRGVPTLSPPDGLYGKTVYIISSSIDFKTPA